ncbi:transposase [Kitasatospora sp. MY 5-36]|uniref:transposase n=1 Tax=Kitasatospora sp. MY 5-36 TaxID=1678027 RepID=UPI0035105ABE
MGVFAAYATSRGHALVNRELYLAKSWTDDRERCRAARIPDERAFATKSELARTMITRAGLALPIVWATADSACNQNSHFRRFLEDAQLSCVVAVPRSQQVHGPRIDHLIGQAPPEAWQRLSAGAAQGRVPLRLGRRPPARRWRPPSRTWSASRAAAGRSRRSSRAPGTNAAWTSTKCAATWAGTGISPLPCSLTRFWPPSPPSLRCLSVNEQRGLSTV